MPYVVVKPESAEGIYDTWDECLAALAGTKGERRYMKVSTREEAHSILNGTGVVLPPGAYAFSDGNALGGVGVVLVQMSERADEPVAKKEIATSVHEIFRDRPLPGLTSADEVQGALDRRRNILCEVAALFVAIEEIPAGSDVTIVHDYVGIADWMEKRSRPPRDAALKSVITECMQVSERKRLKIRYLHQPGHRSTWAGRHDLARFNARADALATQGSGAWLD